MGGKRANRHHAGPRCSTLSPASPPAARQPGSQAAIALMEWNGVWSVHPPETETFIPTTLTLLKPYKESFLHNTKDLLRIAKDFEQYVSL